MDSIVSLIRRNILRSPTSLLINLSGVTIAAAVLLHIARFVQFETGFDTSKEMERVYRVWMERYAANELQTSDKTTYPAVAETLADFEEITHVSRMVSFRNVMQTTEIDGKTLILSSDKPVISVEPAFLEIYPVTILYGRATLDAPFTVMVSQSVVSTYFKGENPIGRVIYQDGDEAFTITGVFQDLELQSSLRTDYIRSYSSLQAHFERLTGRPTTTTLDSWDWPGVRVLAKMAPGTDPMKVQSQLTSFVSEMKSDQLAQGKAEKYYLQPIRDSHLYSVQNQPYGSGSARKKQMVYAIWIGGLLFVIALLNYVNLYLTEGAKRGKEIGVRRINGASHGLLFFQFFVENLWQLLLGVFLGFMVFEITSPIILPFIGLKQVTPVQHVWIWFAMAVIVSAVASVVRVYSITRVNTPDLLKSKDQRTSLMSVKKLFTGFQFGITIFLMIAVYVVFDQVQFMMKKDPGIALDQVLVVKGPRNFNYEVFSNNPDAIKNKLRALASVNDVTTSYSVPGVSMSRYELSRVGSSESQGRFYSSESDKNYLSFFDLTFLAGRNFSDDTEADYRTAILNEQALEQFGFNSPEEALGEYITTPEEGFNREIIGVVANFNHLSLHSSYMPMVFSLDQESRGYYALKIAGEPQEVIRQVEQVFAEVFPGNAFDYFFLDDSFYAQYQADRNNAGILITLFLITALLSGIGLFALASMRTRSRLKEIGIRKVLGASSGRLYWMMSVEFLIIIVLAGVFVIPAAWLTMSNWLNNFAFRIELQMFQMVLPFVLAIVFALITISYQVLKVSRINPVESLKDE